MQRIIVFFLVITSCFLAIPVLAQDESVEDRTLAPYFVVLTDDPTIDRLPLQSTQADVNIAGVIANVKVNQVYKNDGQRPIEAIYVFPLSTNAAVYAMRMTIGDVLIEAQIKEREEARTEYEEAKEEGKSASLLEQNRPNVFQMNVANIMPGDKISVELDYVELLVPEDGVYEFIYPAVVGPRYSEKKISEVDQSEYWVETPYQHEGEEAYYEFNVNVHINSGVPLQSIESPSHSVFVSRFSETEADVVLTTTERAGLKDYILQFNLRGNEIESGVLLYEGEDENFFLVMLEPPSRVELSQIPPREYLFVLDVSGSMRGFPLDVSKTFVKQLLMELRPSDIFNIITFSGGSRVLFDQSVPATEANVQYAIQMIDQLQGGGVTQLLQALQRVFALPLSYEDQIAVARTTVVLTDGYINVEYAVFDEIRNHLNSTNVFSAGIGSSPNRFLIEGMAHVGQGQPLFVANQEEADEKVEKYKNYIKEPILTHINVSFEGFDAYDVEPPSIPDVFAQRPIIVFGKYHGSAEGEIIVTGNTADGEYHREIVLKPDMPRSENIALRYLWARKMIQLKDDYVNMFNNQELVDFITQLGLKYNLLTRYTSFIAVYSEIRNEEGDPTTINQPLPLPEGVSDYAVAVDDWMIHENNVDQAEVRKLPVPAMPQPALVLEIIDPCTFKVKIDDKIILLRLADLELGNDTEQIDRVLEWLRSTLVGKTVMLDQISERMFSADGEPYIEAYVYIDDLNVNLELVKQGVLKFSKK